jgi:hypothetical protein
MSALSTTSALTPKPVPKDEDWSVTNQIVTDAVCDHINRPDQDPRVDVVTASQSMDARGTQTLMLHVRVLSTNAEGAVCVPIVVRHYAFADSNYKSTIYAQYPRFIDDAVQEAAEQDRDGVTNPFYTGTFAWLQKLTQEERNAVALRSSGVSSDSLMELTQEHRSEILSKVARYVLHYVDKIESKSV